MKNNNVLALVLAFVMFVSLMGFVSAADGDVADSNYVQKLVEKRSADSAEFNSPSREGEETPLSAIGKCFSNLGGRIATGAGDLFWTLARNSAIDDNPYLTMDELKRNDAIKSTLAKNEEVSNSDELEREKIITNEEESIYGEGCYDVYVADTGEEVGYYVYEGKLDETGTLQSMFDGQEYYWVEFSSSSGEGEAPVTYAPPIDYENYDCHNEPGFAEGGRYPGTCQDCVYGSKLWQDACTADQECIVDSNGDGNCEDVSWYDGMYDEVSGWFADESSSSEVDILRGYAKISPIVTCYDYDADGVYIGEVEAGLDDYSGCYACSDSEIEECTDYQSGCGQWVWNGNCDYTSEDYGEEEYDPCLEQWNIDGDDFAYECCTVNWEP